MKKIMILIVILLMALVGCAQEPIVKESNFGEECGKEVSERDECCERVMEDKAYVLPACAGEWKWNGELNSCVYDCGFKRLINSFEECVAAGHPVMESYPEQCSDGLRSFTRELRDDERNLNTFCGESYYDKCETHNDCVTSGCSSQICGSEAIISTCEWEDCYDDEAYGIKCGCVENKCQWY